MFIELEVVWDSDEIIPGIDNGIEVGQILIKTDNIISIHNYGPEYTIIILSNHSSFKINKPYPELKKLICERN